MSSRAKLASASIHSCADGRAREIIARSRIRWVAAAALALASVPEVFVVLWARQSGLAVRWVPLIWAAASLTKMLLAYPAGMASDALGRLPLLLVGWSLRVLALAALAVAPARGLGVWMLFLAYSATFALTEPAERSLIGDAAPAAARGTAFGLYHLASGILMLPGALVFGLIWQHVGSTLAFGVAAATTACAAAGMAVSAMPRPAAG